MRNVSGFRGSRHAIWIVAAVCLSLGSLCKKKGDTTGPGNAGGDTSTAVSKVDPTLCDTNGKNVVTYDLNRDNRPDVWRLYKAEEEAGVRLDVLTCKQVDFDHDGNKDWVVGYNRKGSVLFEKADFDYDGRFDMSAIYDVKTAKIVEVERDSDFDGKYDLLEEYDTNGTLTAVKKDRDGNEKPDVWEQYKDGKLIAILYDDDGDEKVDRKEEVPGSRPKTDLPDIMGDIAGSGTGTGTGSGTGTGTGSGTGTGTGSAKTP